MTKKTKIIRLGLFKKYNDLSPRFLATKIQEETGIQTRDDQVIRVIKGEMKSPWIREWIAKELGEPVSLLFPDPYIKKGSGRRSKKAHIPHAA